VKFVYFLHKCTNFWLIFALGKLNHTSNLQNKNTELALAYKQMLSMKKARFMKLQSVILSMQVFVNSQLYI
jgi:hypothetical protein